MDGSAYFSSVGWVHSSSFRIIGSIEGNNFSVGVFFNAGAGDAVGASQANFSSDGESFEFIGGVVHIIFAFDEAFTGEGNGAGTERFILGMIGNFKFFCLVFWIVFDDELNGVEDSHGAGGSFVEVVSYTGF